MGLTTGTKLGPYEIVGALGAGGPAAARALDACERWRSLAEAQLGSLL